LEASVVVHREDVLPVDGEPNSASSGETVRAAHTAETVGQITCGSAVSVASTARKSVDVDIVGRTSDGKQNRIQWNLVDMVTLTDRRRPSDTGCTVRVRSARRIRDISKIGCKRRLARSVHHEVLVVAIRSLDAAR